MTKVGADCRLVRLIHPIVDAKTRIDPHQLASRRREVYCQFMLLGKHTSGAGLQSAAPSEPSLADKIEFLTRRDAYQPPAPEVTRPETHMS